MAVVMTVTLRGSFLDVLQVQTLEVDGNYIYNGLRTARQAEFESALQQNHIDLRGMYPTITARLVSINGVPIDEALTRESDTSEETRSKVRLSWAKTPPANNLMLEGDWPRANSREVSVEAEVMSDLGLSMGDVLGFSVGDQIIEAPISSRREYKGGGSRMMF